MRFRLLAISLIGGLSTLFLVLLMLTTAHSPVAQARTQSRSTNTHLPLDKQNVSLMDSDPLSFTLAFTSYLPLVSRSPQCTIPPEDAVQPGSRLLYSFEGVVPCLNTIDLLGEFIGNNISYLNDPENYNQPAEVTYALGTGDCEDFAQFACTVLYMNGWSYATFDNTQVNSAAGLDVQWGTPTPDGRFPYGHAVCLYRETGEPFLFLDNYGVIKGPFDSVEQAVQRVGDDNSVTQLGRYTFFDEDFHITFEH